ncbi:MAG TPA: dUTP diphosphatase [candidate division Zixibacteria bacterium]|nr:dUTP diphosphatase [candidate division Zixibacteria bacterium]
MERTRIQIKRVRPRSPALPLPGYATEGSAGMDLQADIDSERRVEPMERVLIPTGIAIALPPGFEAQIRPRSGLAFRQGLTLINSPGTIDSDYRGEIQIAVVNLGREPVVIRGGQRIAQLVVQRVCKAEWDEVEELPASGRQEGGFGHTDEK